MRAHPQPLAATLAARRLHRADPFGRQFAQAASRWSFVLRNLPEGSAMRVLTDLYQEAAPARVSS